ncbi:MAG: hypothetical protein F6K11_24225, partial [Leptolyngbya sp. SIO3F4]|nr:hypothetical protein [Leptolyngbya sp. SIO3F4]
IDKRLVSDCAIATVDTQTLLSATDIRIDSWELQNLSVQIYKIYKTLISCYAESFVFSPIVQYLYTIDSEESQLEVAALVIPKFESLLRSVTPMLRELKAIYFSSINQHLVGFMTTHIYFTRYRILNHLTVEETIWLSPYLQLLDELICMPWQHICSVATTINKQADAIALVKRMMPKVNSISALTYQKALQRFPNHISSQGRIQSTPVQYSSLRDLSMFQAYIWLCVLENSSSMIERNLLPICVQVFPLTKVSWELVTFAIQTITNIIQEQLTSTENKLFSVHADKIQTLFINAEPKKHVPSLMERQLQQDNFFNNTSDNW